MRMEWNYSLRWSANGWAGSVLNSGLIWSWESIPNAYDLQKCLGSIMFRSMLLLCHPTVKDTILSELTKALETSMYFHNKRTIVLRWEGAFLMMLIVMTSLVIWYCDIFPLYAGMRCIIDNVCSCDEKQIGTIKPNSNTANNCCVNNKWVKKTHGLGHLTNFYIERKMGHHLFWHTAQKPVTTMLTYPWKCTVLHCNHLGNTWKPLVLMT